MITQWRLNQFKSIRDGQAFALGPLTVFAGANSSGKSSILHSILLVCQTLSSKVSHRQLVLNGDLLRLGTFEDVLAQGSTTREIAIGFDVAFDFQKYRSRRLIQRSYRRSPFYQPGVRSGKFSVDLSFVPSRLEEQDGGMKVRTLQSRLVRGEYRADIETFDPTGRPPANPSIAQQLRLRKRHADDLRNIVADMIAANQEAPFADERLLEYEATLEPNDLISLRRFRGSRLSSWGGRPQLLAAHLDHFLPSILFYTYSVASRKIAGVIDELVEVSRRKLEEVLNQMGTADDEVVKAVLTTVQDLAQKADKSLPDFLSTMEFRAAARRPRASQIGSEEPVYSLADIFKESLSRLTKGIKDQRAIDSADLTEPLTALVAAVTDSFSTLRYLGPLRDEPKPVYSIASSADPSDVGSKGEYTAAVLDLYADHLVDFVRPDDPGCDVLRTPLRNAVLSWMSHFDIAESYRTQEEGKLGHRLFIRPRGIQNDLDLTNVGVGVSQVLPILVMALISEPGAVLLFEQPELHLHPKVQSLLADFFLAIVKSGRQCIVETHSEYLINRLRLRVAESPWESPLKEQITVFFVEREDGASTFKPVRINDYGAIPDWPKGFFDQGPKESDRILKASAAKRKTKPGSGLNNNTSESKGAVDE
jgi:predicted ATPase